MEKILSNASGVFISCKSTGFAFMVVKNVIVVSLYFAVFNAYGIHQEHNVSLTQEYEASKIRIFVFQHEFL